jgi:xylan 1,4-beta-xylosidase
LSTLAACSPEPVEAAVDSTTAESSGLDVGNASGGTRLQNGCRVVTGSGSGFDGNSSDALHLDAVNQSGDFEIGARVGPFMGAAAGLIARASVSPGSAFVAAQVRPNSDTKHWGGLRATTNDGYWAFPLATSYTRGRDTWLRLRRQANTFTWSTSADGVQFSVVSSQSVALPATVSMGLFVASGGSSTSEAVFCDLTGFPASFGGSPDAGTSPEYVFCARENATCSFSGTHAVRYGAAGHFVVKTLTNGTPCTNAVFGDPVPGVAKTCDVGAAVITSGGGSLVPAVYGTDLVVDFGQKIVGAQSQVGFLHGVAPNFFEPNLQTPDSAIAPLTPRTWRMSTIIHSDADQIANYPNGKITLDPARYDRARAELERKKSFGVKNIIVSLNGTWLGQTNDPQKRPIDYLAAWENSCALLADKFRNDNLIWGPWNEPNAHTGDFGPPGSFPSKYYELYKRTYLALKRFIPDPQMAACDFTGIPRSAPYNEGPGSLKDFLDYALANSIRIKYLTIHPLGGTAEVRNTGPYITYLRARFIDNPQYAALGLSGVIVDEALPEGEFNNPGMALATMAQHERAGAVGSCRASWPDAALGATGSAKGSLDHLLRADFGTRASWHVYRAYAEQVPYRVKSGTRAANLEVSAGSQFSHLGSGAKGNLQVGYYNDSAQPGNVSPRNVTLRLNGLHATGLATGATVNIALSKVSPQGYAFVSGPTPAGTVRAVVLAADGGSIDMTLTLGFQEVVLVSLN